MTDKNKAVDKIKPPTEGRIFMSAEHGTVHVPPGEPAPAWATPPPGALERPNESDSKADWVAYAGSVGIKDADSLTKAELIDGTKDKG